MKKLWPQQIGEEKQAVEHKLRRDIFRLCHDKANNKDRNFVMTNPDYVATKLEDKLCREKAKDKTKTNFIATNFYFAATKFLCRDKVFFMSRH